MLRGCSWAGSQSRLEQAGSQRGRETRGGRAEEGARARLHCRDGHQHLPAAELRGGERKIGDSHGQRGEEQRPVHHRSADAGKDSSLSPEQSLAPSKRTLRRAAESRAAADLHAQASGRMTQSSPQWERLTQILPRRGTEPR